MSSARAGWPLPEAKRGASGQPGQSLTEPGGSRVALAVSEDGGFLPGVRRLPLLVERVQSMAVRVQGGGEIGAHPAEFTVQLEGRLVLVQRFLEAVQPAEGLRAQRHVSRQG